MPAALPFGTRVPDHILLAELVDQAFNGLRELADSTDDVCAAATVISQLPQGTPVDRPVPELCLLDTQRINHHVRLPDRLLHLFERHRAVVVVAVGDYE